MEITTEQFKSALSEPGILRDGDLDMLNVHFDCRDCKATATQLCQLLGKQHIVEINRAFGRLGHRIADFLHLDVPTRTDGKSRWWNVLALGEDAGRSFIWELRKELVEALIELEMLDTSNDRIPEEVVSSPADPIFEGAKRTITVNSYERNSTARRICIGHYGATCVICDFKFEDVYGELGRGYIHVHHVVPLSEIDAEYIVDPIQDLRPVCPNCHAMIHRKVPAHTIEGIRAVLVAL